MSATQLNLPPDIILNNGVATDPTVSDDRITDYQKAHAQAAESLGPKPADYFEAARDLLGAIISDPDYPMSIEDVHLLCKLLDRLQASLANWIRRKKITRAMIQLAKNDDRFEITIHNGVPTFKLLGHQEDTGAGKPSSSESNGPSVDDLHASMKAGPDGYGLFRS